jgi:hypothetical protein
VPAGSKRKLGQGKAVGSSLPAALLFVAARLFFRCRTERTVMPLFDESHRSCITMQYYRIYVRLKSGGQATGRELHNGPPPLSGTQLNVPLITGRTVKARIGLPSTKHSKMVGTVVVTVYADEI